MFASIHCTLTEETHVMISSQITLKHKGAQKEAHLSLYKHICHYTMIYWSDIASRSIARTNFAFSRYVRDHESELITQQFVPSIAQGLFFFLPL